MDVNNELCCISSGNCILKVSQVKLYLFFLFKGGGFTGKKEFFSECKNCSNFVALKGLIGKT
jgi:hypothetical protein